MKNLCLGFIFFKLLFIVDAQGKCLSGFTNVNGTCYKVLRVIGNYTTSKAACQKLGKDVDLATIRCQLENDAILEMFWNNKAQVDERQVDKKKYLQSDKHYHLGFICIHRLRFSYQVWIGLHDIAPKEAKSGLWYHEPKVTYRNWASNEPNNAGNRAESVVDLYLDAWGHRKRGQWNDNLLRNVLWGAVCEQLTETSGDGCVTKREAELGRQLAPSFSSYYKKTVQIRKIVDQERAHGANSFGKRRRELPR